MRLDLLSRRAAAALILQASQTAGTELSSGQFVWAFLAITLISLVAVPAFSRLAPDAGYALTSRVTVGASGRAGIAE